MLRENYYADPLINYQYDITIWFSALRYFILFISNFSFFVWFTYINSVSIVPDVLMRTWSIFQLKWRLLIATIIMYGFCWLFWHLFPYYLSLFTSKGFFVISFGRDLMGGCNLSTKKCIWRACLCSLFAACLFYYQESKRFWRVVMGK